MSSHIQGGPHSFEIQATLCDYDMNGDSYQWTLRPRLLHPQTAQLKNDTHTVPLQLRMPPIQWEGGTPSHAIWGTLIT